jgi:2-dehydropantoate 2-reductase
VSESRDIAIVGVGAIGGAAAADLSDLGRHSITLCVRTGFDQLVVDHPKGTSRVDATVLTDPTESTARDPVDWILLATKAHQSEAAAPWLRALAGPQTRVAVLQNGIDHVERIAPLAEFARSIVPVVVQLPAEKTAPGRVTQQHAGALLVPGDADGRAFAELFEGSRAVVAAVDDFTTQAWWKLISNASLGGVCALALRGNDIAAEPESRDLVLALMREVASVGRAHGANLPPDAPEKALARMQQGAPGHWSSIAVDRREGRPMEWRARNAVVGRMGREHGVPTPLNDAVTALLQMADVATLD